MRLVVQHVVWPHGGGGIQGCMSGKKVSPCCQCTVSGNFYILQLLCSAGWLVYVRMDCVFSRMAGVCTNGLCVQPGGWCRLWVWNVSVCIVVALRGKSNFYVRGRLWPLPHRWKLNTLYPGTCAIFVVCPEQCVRRFFPHTVRFFPLRWCGPTTSN